MAIFKELEDAFAFTAHQLMRINRLVIDIFNLLRNRIQQSATRFVGIGRINAAMREHRKRDKDGGRDGTYRGNEGAKSQSHARAIYFSFGNGLYISDPRIESGTFPFNLFLEG